MYGTKWHGCLSNKSFWCIAQTKAAMDVVTSLVGDLNPPDTEPRRRPPRGDAAADAPQLAPLAEIDSLTALPPQPHATHSGTNLNARCIGRCLSQEQIIQCRLQAYRH